MKPTENHLVTGKSATWINTKVTKMMARHEMKRYESGTKEQEKRSVTKLKIVLYGFEGAVYVYDGTAFLNAVEI